MISTNELLESGQFDSAYEQLRNLVNEMESGNLSLDELSERVEKARTLLKFCHDRLRSVKEEIEGINDSPRQS